MYRSLLLVTTLLIVLFAQFGHTTDNLRTAISSVIKTSQDEATLTQIEQRLPKLVELDIPTSENDDKVFTKFKETLKFIPENIDRSTLLNRDTAQAIFPAIQLIHRYVKESVWKSILQVIDLSKELVRIPAQNLPDEQLKKLLSFSKDDTISEVLEYNSNRQDFSDQQKSILVQSYVDRIKSKLNADNFQQLITQKLGASFLRYLPTDFLLHDLIFDDNSVIRNVATWLHLLTPLQRDAISNKVYRSLTDTTGKSILNLMTDRFSPTDPSTLDMIARMTPSLSTRQIINAVGDKIVPLLERSSIGDDQSCTTALALLNRTLEAKRTTNPNLRPNPELIKQWQKCYSGCDLRDLFNNRNDLKELLKSHPDPEHCESLVSEVKKEYNIERDVTVSKLRDVSDAFVSIYRPDEITSLSDGLMADLGRDEKILEQIGSQDLTSNEARAIINKIPRATQNLWGKNMLGKLGNLIPGLDNTILKQILTHGRGDLPALFNNTSPTFIRKLVPSKVRLLIDQYATEPNLAKYRQLLASDYAKKYIKSETLMKILQLSPDILRLIRFTPAQASAAIADRLGSDRKFDGSLSNLATINNFVNGLTKTDIEKIQPKESLQAIQQIFGSSKNKNIDNQMQSNTRMAFGNLLRRGLQTSETTQNADDYIQGLFREDNLVEDLSPQLFTTMTNTELDAINHLNNDKGDRFWYSIGSIREPACCSFVNENRFRLADYALKHYGSSTGDINNFKLSQLGPFLAASLRASDIRRITTDGLINKIDFFKSVCFQPAQAEAQALGARLNDALKEVDDNLKALYLDLIEELAAYLPMDIAVPKRILYQRASFLSQSLDKLQNRDEKCKIPDTNGFLSKASHGIKQTLANAFLDQRSTLNNLRERREADEGRNPITCNDLRKMGTAISALSAKQISSIDNDVLYQCIDVFGEVHDYNSDRVKQIAQKYILTLQNQGRHIPSLSQSELYALNSILTGFTPSELFQLRNEHFREGNFLSFMGNLDGWTMEQLESLAQLSLSNEQRLKPSFLENAGKILCAVDVQLRRVPVADIKSYLSILAHIECPIGSNANYSSVMFDVVKNIYQGDTFRPHIFGSLGTIAAGVKSTDVASLSPELFNFFPSQALSRLPKDVFTSFNDDQLRNLNIEQIKTIPNSLLSSLNETQTSIIHHILDPFHSSEKLVTLSQKSNHNAGPIESGTTMKYSISILIVSILPFISIIFMDRFD